jgi:hypothetical protein
MSTTTKDARGYKLQRGDVVAFNHSCGYRRREMFIGTIVAFEKYVVVKILNGPKVNKLSSSLYKLYGGK